MINVHLSCFHDQYSLLDVLDQLNQLPVRYLQLSSQQLAPGFSLKFQCEAPLDAHSLQASMALLWPDLQVQVQDRSELDCSYIATLMAPVLTPVHLSQLIQQLSGVGLQLLKSRNLTGAGLRAQQAWQLRLAGSANLLEARAILRSLADRLGVDITLQPRAEFGRQGGLICFDMDSTLIKAECIDELAAAAGIGDKVAAITAAAMRGELDFNESFRQRMALLSGLSESVLAGIADRIQLMDGALTLVKSLKARGFYTVILSGGFVYFAEKIQARLGIDEVHANALEIVDGKVSGRVTGTVVDGKRKAALIQQIATQRSLSLSQVIAVGDGANDLPMLGMAGMGVAIHAKPLVRASANYAISTLGLDALCYVLGMQDDDIIFSQ